MKLLVTVILFSVVFYCVTPLNNINHDVLEKIKNGLVNDKINLKDLGQSIKQLTESTKLLSTDLPIEQKREILSKINAELEKIKEMAASSPILKTIINSVEAKVNSAMNLLNSA